MFPNTAAVRIGSAFAGIGIALAPAILNIYIGGAARIIHIDFNRDVRPILSDRCFVCHGPDEKTREADLRLDILDSAAAPRKHGRAVVPGMPNESLLISRINHTDPDEVMPPPASGRKALSKEEKEILQKWIESGAEYSAHWSLVAPKMRALPAVHNKSTVRNEIDLFILKKLEEAGLSPAPAAEKEILLRRLTFDITGLPPTIDELASFVNDPSADAYERAVERLLKSVRFGERMAADWLDLARYADTYGYQSDVHRKVWRYRDWVINAFNNNLPYDQFIEHQIAGDLLPNTTKDQILATAFNRLHRQTNEGGSTEEEYRVEYVADRVHTFGTAFLGLTLECARCHDHKYDPIPQEDYYGLFAFFDDIDESGLYSHFTDATPTPTLALPTPEQTSKIAELINQIQQKETQLASLAAEKRNEFVAWLESAGPLATPRADAYFPLDYIENGKLQNLIDPAKPGGTQDEPEIRAGYSAGSLQFSGDNNATFPGAAEFEQYDPFSFSLWLWAPDRKDRAVILKRSRAWHDAGSQGYQLLIEDGKLTWSLIHFWPGNAISIKTENDVPVQSWTNVTVTYDGSSRAGGLAIYINGEIAKSTVVRDHLWKGIGGGDPGALTLAERFRDQGFKNGKMDELRVFARCLSAVEIDSIVHPGKPGLLEKAKKNHGGAEFSALYQYYLSAVDPGAEALRSQLKNARKELANLRAGIEEIMVMKDREPAREVFVFNRGRYDSPDPARRVQPHTPVALPRMDPKQKRDRLALAKWLTSENNPLTARVAVNRIWSQFFGRGIVNTTENFGSQGGIPTHPELLDWLALKFIELKWDTKALIRMIVNSGAYQQSSRMEEPGASLDPENKYISRMPARRLSAEMLRDHVLYSSGLLVEKTGGESVKPWQPPGLWNIGWGGEYVSDTGDGRWRRSLYTYWRRTAPPPNMILFDAARREVCVARRQDTNTPLQSLVLFNDPQFYEAAKTLAEKVLQITNLSNNGRIGRVFEILTSRRSTESELSNLEQLFESQKSSFNGDPAAAELFAMTLVASTVMASDAAVVRR
ncbi:MAG: DUF1553 domain-containing protein [Planctomycetota bacterium]